MRQLKSKNGFCTHCGLSLRRKLVPASEAMGIYGFSIYSRYNKDTGEEQFIYNHYCSKVPKWWILKLFTKHTDYYDTSKLYMRQRRKNHEKDP